MQVVNNGDMARIEELARMVADSRVRNDTLMCLYKKCGSEILVKTIAKNIKADRENVLGAIRGMDNRYKEEYSLAYLELAHIKEVLDNGHVSHTATITSLGIQVVEYMIEKNGNN